MGLPQLTGVIGGILAILAGILIFFRPKFGLWTLSVFLIIYGVNAIVVAAGLW